MRQLLPIEFPVFIEAIGHSPETTISIHRLKQQTADVFMVGEPDNFAAAIIQAHDDKAEPIGFGADAEAYWQILQKLAGWDCIEVSLEIAPELSALMPENRLYQDSYYQLDGPINPYSLPNIEIRLLTEADLELVKHSEPHYQPHTFGSIEASLKYGINAGAIIDGRLIAIADSFLAEKYGEIGVYTHEDWRKQGFSTACTALVADAMQKRGLIPVWSTGEDNIASQRVALKLGFHEVTRMIYLIPTRAA